MRGIFALLVSALAVCRIQVRTSFPFIFSFYLFGGKNRSANSRARFLGTRSDRAVGAGGGGGRSWWSSIRARVGGGGESWGRGRIFLEIGAGFGGFSGRLFRDFGDLWGNVIWMLN